MLRPAAATRSGDFNLGRQDLMPQFQFPPLEVLDAFVFAIFSMLSLLMAMSLFGYRASFKPADVDVLFPTPINPKIVLAFRMVRDYLASLIIPILMIGIGWKPASRGLEAIFRDVPNPQTAGYTFRALSLGFVLVILAWVAMGYALSMYVNRNDRNSERRKKLIAWVIGVLNVGMFVFALYSAQRFTSVDDFVRFTQQPLLRGFFFTATPGAKMVMGPLSGDMSSMFFGAAVLVGISAVCVLLALNQAGWMYDQSAVRGFGAENMRNLQRKGDMMGLMAETARQGKLKVKRWGWFQRLNWKGFGGLIWKDFLIQWRSIRYLILLFIIIGVSVAIVPSLASRRPERLGGFTVLFGEGFVVFMIAQMISQSGFSELLRRVDLQKPLPFTPSHIVAAEVIAKSIPCLAIPLIGSLVSVIFMPSQWAYAVAALAFFPTVGLMICSIMCLIVLVFPDIDDVAQRGFRGIVSLFGIAVAVAPGALTFMLFAGVFKWLVLGAAIGAAVNVAISLGVVLIAGRLYASFNPSE